MFIYNHFSYYIMASPSSKALPYITLFTVIGVFGADIFLDFDISMEHVAGLGALLSTLGLGGVYNGIRKGYTASQEIKSTQSYNDIAQSIKEKLEKEGYIKQQ